MMIPPFSSPERVVLDFQTPGVIGGEVVVPRGAVVELRGKVSGLQPRTFAITVDGIPVARRGGTDEFALAFSTAVMDEGIHDVGVSWYRGRGETVALRGFRLRVLTRDPFSMTTRFDARRVRMTVGVAGGVPASAPRFRVKDETGELAPWSESPGAEAAPERLAPGPHVYDAEVELGHGVRWRIAPARVEVPALLTLTPPVSLRPLTMVTEKTRRASVSGTLSVDPLCPAKPERLLGPEGREWPLPPGGGWRVPVGELPEGEVALRIRARLPDGGTVISAPLTLRVRHDRTLLCALARERTERMLREVVPPLVEAFYLTYGVRRKGDDETLYAFQDGRVVPIRRSADLRGPVLRYDAWPVFVRVRDAVGEIRPLRLDVRMTAADIRRLDIGLGPLRDLTAALDAHARAYRALTGPPSLDTNPDVASILSSRLSGDMADLLPSLDAAVASLRAARAAWPRFTGRPKAALPFDDRMGRVRRRWLDTVPPRVDALDWRAWTLSMMRPAVVPRAYPLDGREKLRILCAESEEGALGWVAADLARSPQTLAPGSREIVGGAVLRPDQVQELLGRRLDLSRWYGSMAGVRSDMDALDELKRKRYPTDADRKEIRRLARRIEAGLDETWQEFVRIRKGDERFTYDVFPHAVKADFGGGL